MASSARTGSAGAAYDVRTQIDFQGVAIVQRPNFHLKLGISSAEKLNNDKE
jgi:hypothetical protein